MLSVQKKVDTRRADHGVQMLSNLLLKTPLVLRAPVHGGEENHAPRSGHVSQSPEDLGLAIKGMVGTSGIPVARATLNGRALPCVCIFPKCTFGKIGRPVLVS